MARTLLVTDYPSLRVWTLYGDQACVNTFDYIILNGGFVSGVTDLDLVTALDTLAAPLYKAILGNLASYRGCQLTYLNVRPLPYTQFSLVSPGVGSAGATLMATQTRGITRRVSNYAGRTYRGRIYWPFPSTSSDLAGAQPTAGYGIACQAVLNAIAPVGGVTIVGHGGSATLSPILWNRKTQVPTAITGYVTIQEWATQRKSGLGYGRPNTSPL